MKKITEVIKPLLSIIFGALLLLLYLGYLRDGMPAFPLTIAIFGVIFAAYYITIGILNIVVGNKLNATLRLVFDILNVSLYALLFFLMRLSVIVEMADMMSPTAWIICILSMVAAIGLIVLFIVSKFAKAPVVNRLTFMFAGIFALALLLDVVFDVSGAPEAIGNIIVVVLALYGMFVSIMFTAIGKPELQNEKPVEEQPQEEQPAEEAQEQQNQVDDKSYEEFLAYQQEDKKE